MRRHLLSLAATFGVMTWFWQQGHGSDALFGIPATGAITFWLPLMIFAFLFGLSMDYEVFLVSRMHEEWTHTRDAHYAARHGLAMTGKVVTAAAIIMIAAFAGFVTGSFVGLQEFGLGLAVAILLDATIVRSILVPATMKLLGDWNWYLPSWLEWLPRIAVASEPEPIVEAPPVPATR